MTTKRVYLDTETGGFDPVAHDLVEVAYAVDDGEIKSFVVPHDWRRLTPAAMRVNRYFDRRLDDEETWADHGVIRYFLGETLAGATIVGSNPAFDIDFLKSFIQKRMPSIKTCWKHHTIDVGTVAMAVWGLDEPLRLREVCERLDLEVPPHTAAGDVDLVRRCMWELEGARL